MSLIKPNMKDQTMLNMIDSSPQRESHDKPALTSWSNRRSCMYCMDWTSDSFMATSHLNENCSSGMCYSCKHRQLTSARPTDFTLSDPKINLAFLGAERFLRTWNLCRLKFHIECVKIYFVCSITLEGWLVKCFFEAHGIFCCCCSTTDGHWEI